MEPVSAKLYELESEQNRAREDSATPGLGFSALNRDCPATTHLRTFLAHLVFGTSVAAATETGWTLLHRRP